MLSLAKFHRVARSFQAFVLVSMLKHKRVVGAEFLSGDSPQGLSVPMLVVSFYLVTVHFSVLLLSYLS